MHIAHKAFAIGLLTGALLGSFGREAAAHGDASWIMENPETRVCCGPQDCGPLRIYDGTAEEISTGEWQVTIPPGTHPLVPRGDTRVFREGERGTYTSQRLEPYVCAYGGQIRCFFAEPMGF
jgi:hypothetical protein